ncbi:poly-gamma-glutamate synthesis protein (capsule biosynthesis protein) [Geosporobacter subterraneus DSM 17957]|uniref:Poly-gamma-glutamate synthesis protein (Capsule biosynthesis protein) n=1 Tax=Geosporobacter subterraneus DSM 17957 TaxID=1121919 RepID=A0A1M6I175_9FIRM|nr:CapA family protein [Geosporobacter subterraneus]SHJ28239.1 poly-gamma-glutamate synthesis protein (capsule biosynthesis protein) [Geosporobacter subterraneus DSM 17957]
MDRGVRKSIERHGYDYPYLKVEEYLKKGDITFANLESPLTSRDTAVLKDRALIFKGDIENGRSLKAAGFNILNLANNHTLDYGPEGLIDTLEVLEENGILPLGAGLNAQEARQPVFVNIKGITVGFLGYSQFPPEGYLYFSDRPEVARINPDTISAEITRAKESCDFLVISFHWGKEYDVYPSEFQKSLARLAVDRGGDLILGHHPHVLQSMEKYQGKLIFYSLGNFVFDRQIQPGTDETIMLNVKLSKGQWQEADLIPARIIDCQPIPVAGEDGEEILKRLQKYSEGYNSELIIRDGKGYIAP